MELYGLEGAHDTFLNAKTENWCDFLLTLAICCHVKLPDGRNERNRRFGRFRLRQVGIGEAVEAVKKRSDGVPVGKAEGRRMKSRTWYRICREPRYRAEVGAVILTAGCCA